jgi:hypothetical protein
MRRPALAQPKSNSRFHCGYGELRLAIGQRLLNLVADGVTDPSRLRYFTVACFFHVTEKVPGNEAQGDPICARHANDKARELGWIV